MLRLVPCASRMVFVHAENQENLPVKDQIWQWKQWPIQVVASEWLPKLKTSFLKDLKFNWSHKRYSKVAFQLSGAGLFMAEIVLGSYLTVAGAIRLVRALTETTKSMPSNTAFTATGYDNGSGLTYVTASEVRLATSSAWWNGSFQAKKDLTLKNLEDIFGFLKL